MKAITDYSLSRANDVIGGFITSCSHSLRGPLKSIEGLTNLLRNPTTYSDNERGVFLDLIMKSSLRMENMLDELEHFLENSQRDMTIRPVLLKELVDLVLTSFKKEVRELRLEVAVEIPSDLQLLTDANRLRLVLTHLVSNVLNFYDPGKDQHSMKVRANKVAHGTIISVADNGIGMSEEQQPRVFDLFYRATERSSGAGIGLYVVREVTTKMGGTITVDSRIGVGSTFTVFLPDSNVCY